jgi:hypothetical protein
MLEIEVLHDTKVVDPLWITHVMHPGAYQVVATAGIIHGRHLIPKRLLLCLVK